MQQNKDANFGGNTKTIVEAEFNTSVSSNIKYQVFNSVVFYDFIKKGRKAKFLRWDMYTGDVEVDLGMNVKYINYKIEVKDNTNTNPASYEAVNAFIVLPYIGMKYYLYDFALYGNASMLSFAEEKALSYQVGIEYRVMKNLYLSVSRLYEDFEATEKKDTINFKVIGNKFSFKYLF
jgi:hypothetical protein